jgi:alpha-mannosidase
VAEGIDHYSVLLPPGVGVKSDCVVRITLRTSGHEVSESVSVPTKRQWSVYIYPHSHADIGYTNTHANVELIHKRNLINGIELAKKTAGYPDDIFPMSWAMADNTPIDADLPDAVKSWNEDYAFPHLIIASATDIMKTFEERYGDQLPVLRGDFTEYWTDGLGTDAKQTGMNRSSKERLIQAETLWTMLHPGEGAPRADFNEAWRDVIMGTEHTWCYMDPGKQPISGDILKIKFGFFQSAENLSKSLLNQALSTVVDSTSSEIGVFNTLSWPRKGLVYVPADQSRLYSSVCDVKGKSVLSQRLSTGELAFMASDIPAFGSKIYFLKKSKPVAAGKMAREIVLEKVLKCVLDNGLVRVVIDPESGDISSLTANNNEFANQNAACALNSYWYLHGNGLLSARGPQYSKEVAGSAKLFSETSALASGATNVKVVIHENGPLLASIKVESNAEGCNSLSREISLVAQQIHPNGSEKTNPALRFISGHRKSR